MLSLKKTNEAGVVSSLLHATEQMPGSLDRATALVYTQRAVHYWQGLATSYNAGTNQMGGAGGSGVQGYRT